MDALRTTKLEPESPGGTPEERTPNSSVDSFDSGGKVDTLEEQKAYFKKALLGRKLLVAGGDLIRKLKLPVRSNLGLTKFNFSDQENAKKLYLGMIPDNVAERKIPEGAKFVSILQPFEADFMDKSTHSSRVVVNSEDNVGMQGEEITAGVAALNKALSAEDNAPVYLHCKSGVGRSATVLAAYLMQHQSMTLDEAIDRVQRDRPDAQLRGWFKKDTKHTKALRAWYQEEPLTLN